MHTEEEAGKRVCCGPEHISTTGHCIGSACMAWRWGLSLWKQEAKPGHKVPGFPNDGAGPKTTETFGETRVASRTNGVKKPVETKRGYCGLSGSPSPSMGVK